MAHSSGLSRLSFVFMCRTRTAELQDEFVNNPPCRVNPYAVWCVYHLVCLCDILKLSTASTIIKHSIRYQKTYNMMVYDRLFIMCRHQRTTFQCNFHNRQVIISLPLKTFRSNIIAVEEKGSGFNIYCSSLVCALREVFSWIKPAQNSSWTSGSHLFISWKDLFDCLYIIRIPCTPFNI